MREREHVYVHQNKWNISLLETKKKHENETFSDCIMMENQNGKQAYIVKLC